MSGRTIERPTMRTIVFASPEQEAELDAQLAAGVATLQDQRDAAEADMAVAISLRQAAIDVKAAAVAQRAAVAAFVPSASYSAAQLAAVRDQLVTILDRQALIVQTLADSFAYRAAVDQNAVTTNEALLWVARFVRGVLDSDAEGGA